MEGDTLGMIVFRDFNLCLENKCSLCSSTRAKDDCPLLLVHLAHTERYFGPRDRKSGKTTALVALAESLFSEGYKVRLVVHNEAMAERVRRNHHPSCEVESIRSRSFSRGIGNDVLLVLDEIKPEDVPQWIDRSKVVGHLWTP